MKKGQSPKKCNHCDERSLTGLKPGIGLCQYHYNVLMWGRKWADECRERQKKETE